jgi:hypothetical protein
MTLLRATMVDALGFVPTLLEADGVWVRDVEFAEP